jgi:hypothetical protein
LRNLLDKEHPYRMWVLMNIANVYHSRFRQTYDSKDFEKAVSQYRGTHLFVLRTTRVRTYPY